MFDLSLIIILYKKDIFESDTVSSLNHALEDLKDKKINVLIVDNSEEQSVSKISFKILKEQISEYASISLAQDFSNENLGVIYNYGIDKSESKHYCFLDHDTQLNKNYFSSFFEHSSHTFAGIYVPKILQDNGLLYSPRRQKTIVDIFNFQKTKTLPSEVSGLTSSEDFFAVMSGLIVHGEVFRRGFSFNETIKLYGLDNMLFEYYNRNYNECYILPEFLKHSISYIEESEIDFRMFRYKERQTSTFLISKFIRRSLIRTYTSLVFSAIFNALKYRSLRPISISIKIMYKK